MNKKTIAEYLNSVSFRFTLTKGNDRSVFSVIGLEDATHQVHRMHEAGWNVLVQVSESTAKEIKDEIKSRMTLAFTHSA